MQFQKFFKMASRGYLPSYLVWQIKTPVPSCFHTDNSRPLRVSTLYRWIDIAIQSQFSIEIDVGRYALYPVNVTPDYIFTYDITRIQNAPALEKTSDDRLAPGDYGIFNLGKDMAILHLFHT